MSQLADAVKQVASNPLEQLRDPVLNDMQAVNQLIIKELGSKVPLIQEVCQHIISSGGKRLRPLLVLLSARACGYQTGQAHLDLAVVIEFIHTATLLHDDVVDQSTQRRGQDTANAIWGNQASVLVGDFLYSRAFQVITRHNENNIMQVLAGATNAIAEGEVMQLANQHNPDLTEADYMHVILCKTAKLFEAASTIGSIIACEQTARHKAFSQYGHHLGLAFQIIDDMLDYNADAKRLGKNLGDDLAEGKVTLPLIYTLNHCDTATRDLIQAAIRKGNLDQFEQIKLAMQTTRALNYCYDKAQAHIETAKAALNILPDSIYRQALYQLADFTLERSY
ncbi:MAG: polyprenyl synthetase family protein [Gammaproteobacteria bacterium]|nr:polyprenyl synthetase family protein [Gammaproteobacteria bacterium]